MSFIFQFFFFTAVNFASYNLFVHLLPLFVLLIYAENQQNFLSTTAQITTPSSH